MGSSASFGKQFGVCSGSLQLAYRDHLSTWDPWHKFHLSSFNRQYYFQTAPAEHTVWRKTNEIPIWHSVKKNDVKIATIGWQLHCRQEIQIRRHIWLVEFHIAVSRETTGCPWQAQLGLCVLYVFIYQSRSYPKSTSPQAHHVIRLNPELPWWWSPIWILVNIDLWNFIC